MKPLNICKINCIHHQRLTNTYNAAGSSEATKYGFLGATIPAASITLSPLSIAEALLGLDLWPTSGETEKHTPNN